MLDDHEVYTQRLEDALRASDRAMPVLNAGKSTMSVADYVFHAPYYRRTHHPRWTIIQLRDPDVTDDAWKSEPGVALFDRQDGTLVVRPPDVTPPSGLKRAIFEPRQRFSLLGFAITRLQKFALAAKQEPPLFRAGSEHKKAASPAVEYPIEDELAMLVQAFEGRVTFLYLPPYDPRGLEEPTQIEHRVAKACARAGWSFVNLRDRFPEFMAGSIAPYGFDNTSFNSGHLNRAGHAAAAKALQAEMERLLSLAVL